MSLASYLRAPPLHSYLSSRALLCELRSLRKSRWCKRRCASAYAPERSSVSSIQAESTWERVLRYPDGQERRIRYPVKDHKEEEDVTSSSDGIETSADWWGVEYYYYELSSDEEDEINTIPGARLAQPLSPDTGQIDPRAPAEVVERHATVHQGLPSSPGELLRYINSEEYQAARAEQLRLVQKSYKILENSPWVQSKPLYVLAMQQPGREGYSTYTLRTRVQRRGAEDELTKILGRTRKDGSALIKVEELRDGVVAFEDESDAHRFLSLLEADGTQVIVAQCDGHALFRETAVTHAVVVLLQECQGLACHIPMPEELTSCLRGQRSLEDPNSL